MKRFLCLLICASVCAASFASCSDKAVKKTDATTAPSSGTASEKTAEEILNDRSSVKDNLPDLDFGGKNITIVHRGGFDSVEICVEELTGDVVDDAVYKRNIDVEERLNIKFKYFKVGTSTAQEFPGAVKSSVLAGSDEFDIIAWDQYSVLPLATQNMYLNLIDAPYLDLDMPWWNSNYMDTLSIGNTERFFLMGDICMTALKGTGCVFFNKKLYGDLIGNPDDLYKTVLDGNFTLDTFREITQQGYIDLNGNGNADADDQFGCEASTIANTEHFAYAAGMVMSRRGADGLPVYDPLTERNAAVAQKMYELYYETNGMRVLRDDNGYLSDSLAKVFAADKMIFMPLWLQTSDYLRDMESDYGVVPYPKLDESQLAYRALIHDTASIICIPTTCAASDAACAVIEAMCAENYRTVMPAYYEVALKTKYSRDKMSIDMIDLIHDSQATDFIYVYNYALNSAGTVMRTLIANKQNTFTSTVEEKVQTVNELLNKLTETYIKNN